MPCPSPPAGTSNQVYAHWHAFPLRHFNTSGGQSSDNYTSWLRPTGTYESIGGGLRERPVPILPVPPLETDYLNRDMKADIQTAAAAGIDGDHRHLRM